MAVPIPVSLPPEHLQAKALTALLSRLDPSKTDVQLLTIILALTAHQSLQGNQPDIRPLQSLHKLAETLTIPFQLVLHAVIAYPTHLAPVSSLVDLVISKSPEHVETIRTEVLPDLVTRLRLSSSLSDLSTSIRIILSIIRSHEELLGLVLSEADYVLPALKDAYPKLGTSKEGLKAKSDVLVICHTLIKVMDGGSGGGKEALKRLMSDNVGSSRKVLVEGNLRNDYEAVYERMTEIGEDEISALRAAQDEGARNDPRVERLLNLFPDLSPVHLLQALNHPSYAPQSACTIDEAVAPLIDAIVSGGQSLPDELAELKQTIKHNLQPDHSISFTQTGSSHQAGVGKITRNNIWNAEALDVSRLKIKDDDDVPTPQIGNTIPDHLRESIMRLVQSQEEEEEEVARALREAHGDIPEEGEDETTRAIRVLGGDESEDDSGDKVVPKKESGLYDVDQQTKLELAYLSDPKVFDRDGNTRRSEGRRKLKEITGMDDSQLEGWRVMLERNPHKEAILSRHTFAPKKNYLGDTGTSKGKGGGHSNGGEGNNNAGGSSGGGRGGSNGGKGGGRGRGGKGSRGHSNAARTRGHDRKMTRMGAGV